MKSRDIKHKLLIVQGFLQRLDIDYEETSSPMMDTTIFRYLICLIVLERLDIYIYIYIQIPEATNSKHCNIYSIKLQRSLYRLSNPKTCGTITSMNI